MLQAMQEVTDWGDAKINHIYLMGGDSAHAYVPFGQTEAKYFKRPIRLSLSGRQFNKVDIRTHFPLSAPADATDLIKVKGSKDAVYWIDLDAMTCTCSGFKFRGTCKHIELYDK